jgi:CelD/BcsL family acetyltransferase involved in cellulose biosynthesis
VPPQGQWDEVTVPFATRRWIAAALEAREAAEEVHVFYDRLAGRVRSALPLFVVRARHRGLPVRTATVLGDTWSLVDLPATEAGSDALVAWLLSNESGHWHVATIGPIVDLERLASLRARLDARGARHEVAPMALQYLRLAPTWEAFLDERSRNFRRTVKRKAKAFAEAGLTVRHMTCPSVEDLRRTVFAVSDRSWQGTSGVAPATQVAGRRLYERLCGDGTDFSLEVTSAWHGDTCVAYLLGVRHGRTYHALDTGFDPVWREAAPGTVLHHAALQQMCDGTVLDVNFGSAHDYKDRFDVESRPGFILRVYRSRSLFALDALAARARRVLRRDSGAIPALKDDEG